MVVEGCGVVSRVQACGANPESMSCVTTEHPNLPQSPDGGRTDGGGGGGPGKRSKVIGFPVKWRDWQ